MTVHMRVEIRV